MDDTSSSYRVSPFRHLRIKDYLHLPAAFRSLSRLSSALSAKASTLRSSGLNLFDAERCIINNLKNCVVVHNLVLFLGCLDC